MFGKVIPFKTDPAAWQWRVIELAHNVVVQARYGEAEWFMVRQYELSEKIPAVAWAQENDGKNPFDVIVIWQTGMNHYAGQV